MNDIDNGIDGINIPVCIEDISDYGTDILQHYLRHIPKRRLDADDEQNLYQSKTDKQPTRTPHANTRLAFGLLTNSLQNKTHAVSPAPFQPGSRHASPLDQRPSSAGEGGLIVGINARREKSRFCFTSQTAFPTPAAPGRSEEGFRSRASLFNRLRGLIHENQSPEN